MNNEFVKKAIETLNDGGLLLYPTDTVWGLGCDACNAEAVEKLYKLKQRSEEKSMLILLHSINQIYSYIDEVPEVALDVLELANTPTTVILFGARNITPNLIAADGSIGIRIPQNEFLEQLLARFRRPLVSTSANFSGDKTPLFFNEIKDDLKKMVDYVVPYNQTEQKTVKPKPSAIMRIGKGGEIDLIRN